MHNRIVHPPLPPNPLKILDVGFGTGTTTRYLGALHPSATVYGVDISPPVATAPDPNPPPNVSYITGDIRTVVAQTSDADARLATGTLDYVFQRLLICGMTDWPSHIRAMATLLKNGGWIEVHEYANVWFKDGEGVCSGDWKWLKVMREGASGLGLDLDCGVNAREYMAEAGLVDVEVVRYAVPYGTWMAEERGRPETRAIGEQEAEVMGRLFSEHVLPGVTRDLGLSGAELRELQEECKRCLVGEEGKYCYFYVTIGRKVGRNDFPELGDAD